MARSRLYYTFRLLRAFVPLRLCVSSFMARTPHIAPPLSSPARLYRGLLFCLLVLSALATSVADQPEPRISLPRGETLLTDIGIYRVSWQSYGQPAVAMPGAWMGHFEAGSGISYQPWGRVLGRQALLMHSPWHVPPGKIWADYPLRLPKTAPIQLNFRIAMGPDVAVPGKSDGVTFSCYLIADGKSQELMRRHHDKAQWIDYSFDLSPNAGRSVTVRMQVEPGPRNDASFDYSFFGDAKITVGNAGGNRGDLSKEVISSKAYRATEKASLIALCTSVSTGVATSNLLPYTNRIEPSGRNWRFIYEGADCRLVYTLAPSSGALEDWTVQIDDQPPFQPAAGGGVFTLADDHGMQFEKPLRGGKPSMVDRTGSGLTVVWRYEVEGRPLEITWSYQIRGKALLCGVACRSPIATRFSLGGLGAVPMRKTFDVPYFAGHLQYLRTPGVFVGRCIDWTQSHASQCPEGEAVYEPKTDGRRNELSEHGYVVVSPDLGEALPSISNPPSPYRELLGPRIMLDIWSHHQGTFQGDAESLRNLKDNGIDHVAIILHDWQRYGYDVKLPDHLPANPQFGGDAGMIAFGRAANDCGYVCSLHENYIDLYPDAPSYDPATRVLNGDGSPSKAWYNPGTKVQSYGLKCNRAMDFAQQNAPEIHRRYGTTAAYLDVHTCVPPWHQLDHQSDQPMAAMALCKFTNDSKLFQFMRDTHHGPLLGEGANHFYWAGLCDGVEGQVQGGEDHAPLLDFDLLKLHPRMVNHGMGYYERWFRRGYSLRWGYDAGSVEQIDKYRAQELAYGHAGFIGSPHTDNVAWVAREHHLMHAVQRLYGASLPEEVRYEVDGQWVTASAALVAGNTSRQRIRYASGLTLWVNWRTESWQVEGRHLPQWGFLAIGPLTEVSTALYDGRVADYAQCPEYIFVDARTSFQATGRRTRKDIEPRLTAMKYLGGNRIQVTYEWIVNDSLDADYHCFVHGINAGSELSEGIAFQQDHALTQPTSQWRPGTRIVDGPYEFSVPPAFDRYDLTIGLYKNERVALKGAGPEDRVTLAHLKITRKGDQVVQITAEQPAKELKQTTENKADFSAHMNREGTWIDFGPVATDGALKINRAKDRLVIFPYPREKQFHVSLDLKAIAPAAEPSRVTVRALAAGDAKDLGPAEFRCERGRLLITAGHPRAGRYLVHW
jgi:hypothetical protein